MGDRTHPGAHLCFPAATGIPLHPSHDPLADAVPQSTELRAEPASFGQQRLWLLNQLAPASASYNVPRQIRIAGPLNYDALARTLEEIVRRHEPLRTRFAVVDGALTQLIEPVRSLRLARTDLAKSGRAARERAWRRLAAREARTPFDLARGPLIRTRPLNASGR